MLVRPQISTPSFVKSPTKHQPSKLAGKIPGAFPSDCAPSPKSVRLVSEADETLRLKER